MEGLLCTFYLSNLLIGELDDISFKSWRFLTFVALQPAIVITNYLIGILAQQSYSSYCNLSLSDGLTLVSIEFKRQSESRKKRSSKMPS